MTDINFKKVEDSRAGKMYLHLLFEGGKGDTQHPVDILIEGVRFDSYKEPENMTIIQDLVKKYDTLRNFLDMHECETNLYEIAEKEYGKEIAVLVDNTPNDPESDYQFKCYLSTIQLVAYDIDAAKYVAYL